MYIVIYIFIYTSIYLIRSTYTSLCNTKFLHDYVIISLSFSLGTFMWIFYLPFLQHAHSYKSKSFKTWYYYITVFPPSSFCYPFLFYPSISTLLLVGTLNEFSFLLFFYTPIHMTFISLLFFYHPSLFFYPSFFCRHL